MKPRIWGTKSHIEIYFDRDTIVKVKNSSATINVEVLAEKKLTEPQAAVVARVMSYLTFGVITHDGPALCKTQKIVDFTFLAEDSEIVSEGVMPW